MEIKNTKQRQKLCRCATGSFIESQNNSLICVLDTEKKNHRTGMKNKKQWGGKRVYFVHDLENERSGMKDV